MNTTGPVSGMHHIAIQCRDFQESLRFYRDVLGMKPVLEFGTDREIVLVDLGDGTHLELLGPIQDVPQSEILSTPSHPLMHIALASKDARAATEIVRQAGFPITVEPKDVMLGTMKVTNAFFTGPNGESLEFFQVHA
jgi:catechol 2,3-dioxygenase-like lactoylglutathione lyase family enzyme